ncbi:uncharacterized protein LACBIDRAFT_310753 [Laccaria bicolor S238N-H82]|uniref:Predicted protein n=1 Tax=Laccaria bicolor (strain S238N-H82 / ATCC MYA-4686) TaxID=486041 RepID=B0DV11_LACBS|nr:uncharacterized protein LACBIDRAFT_310753 [Laccaria bicolor S238N-H82]EDR01634.1 predicted protein [Laccaria bicolor S238N-H82]|eukprot:XP_001887710.1 predicted protein [Laccaria bicolor S238N-H82]
MKTALRDFLSDRLVSVCVTIHGNRVSQAAYTLRFSHRLRTEYWRTSPEDCVTDLYVPYHPLGLGSRTLGISSGLYDDVLRTTCRRNEVYTRCRGEGICGGEEPKSVVHRRGQLTNPGTSLLFLTMLWPWLKIDQKTINVRRTRLSTAHLIALDHLLYVKRWESSCTFSCFGVNDVATLRRRVYTNEPT